MQTVRLWSEFQPDTVRIKLSCLVEVTGAKPQFLEEGTGQITRLGVCNEKNMSNF
jgi:hypothetical protein